jgi:uncharacterized protein YjbI with pentapeptide repeats
MIKQHFAGPTRYCGWKVLMKRAVLTLAAVLAPLTVALPAYSENVEHTSQLLATRQCPRCDLSRVGLIFANLMNANLAQADLSGANLSRANLQGADLRGANLVGASLNGANLAGAKLDGANLAGADLRGAYLVGTSLTNAAMDNAYLQGAVGLPSTMGKAEDFYRWAIQEQQSKNYLGAIANFTEVLQRQPDFAPAYFGRAGARADGGDIKGAIADTRKAQKLFQAQGDTKNAAIAEKIALALENPPQPKKPKGNFGNALLGILGIGLQFFLSGFSLL